MVVPCRAENPQKAVPGRKLLLLLVWEQHGENQLLFFYKSLRVRSLFWRDGELPWRDPPGSAPAYPTDPPQHQSGCFSGCHNDFLGDNDLLG